MIEPGDKNDESKASAPPAETVEPDNPPTRRLFLQLGILSLLLVIALGGLWQLFKADTSAEIYSKELSVPSRELLEVMARDEGLLTRYDLLDQKRGVYQIPVKRAMELILAEPTLLASQTVKR